MNTCENCQHWLESESVSYIISGPEGYCERIPILRDVILWLDNGGSQIKPESQDCLAFSMSGHLVTKRTFSCAMHKAKSPGT